MIGHAAKLIGALVGGAMAASSLAATTQTIGAGSAVTSVDRVATFDTMTSSNAVNLDNYAESGLSITTASTSWGEDSALQAMDPFHGANGSDRAFYAMANGSDTWVTIRTTDSKPIFGLEFLYGNTWTTGDVYGQYPWGNHLAVLEWETWKSGNLVSSGSVGGGPLLEMGTVVGFSDPVGFDRLLVRATMNGDPSLQAVALDNLQVQLTPIPEPGTWALLSAGVGVIALMARRQAT